MMNREGLWILTAVSSEIFPRETDIQGSRGERGREKEEERVRKLISGQLV